MLNYVIRRLILLPLTLLGIILVNFTIINLAPGDPVTLTEISQEGGATRSEQQSLVFGSDRRYLQFREHYGLTLPVLLNTWPFESYEDVKATLETLLHRDSLPVSEYDSLRVKTGDQARFVMPQLLKIIRDASLPLELRSLASHFFARGGTQQAYLGPSLTEEQKAFNRRIATDNQLLSELTIQNSDNLEVVKNKVAGMEAWYLKTSDIYRFEPASLERIRMMFFETRFFRYMSRVLTLDFGTLRNDDSRTVLSEVTSRFRYSLTLAILPMLMTFVFCQIFGCLMAYNQNAWPDISLNMLFLVLYAIPIFVVAPFLIEEFGLKGHFPFTDTPIPYSGFTSPEGVYEKMNTWQRLIDILKHIYLPLIAIMYGGMAAQSRLSRTAILEVLRQDYVRTAKAKGVPRFTILFKHVGRNAAITIVTSIAGSLGIILGGSLVVETLFEINGFGKFFYDAVINWDYNVIMFSALAGAFLTLVGYLVADIAYTLLDPRVSLE